VGGDGTACTVSEILFTEAAFAVVFKLTPTTSTARPAVIALLPPPLRHLQVRDCVVPASATLHRAVRAQRK